MAPYLSPEPVRKVKTNEPAIRGAYGAVCGGVAGVGV